MQSLSEYYALLGLQTGAATTEVKQAYRRLAKQWHPDNFPNDPVQRQQAEDKIKQINIAYAALKSITPASVGSQERSTQTYTSTSTKTTTSTRPNSPVDQYNQAVELVQAGDYEEALSVLTQAIRLDPNYLAAYRCRAYVLSELGYEYRAASDFRKIKELELQQSSQAASVKTSTSSGTSANSADSSSMHSDQGNQPWQRIKVFSGHTDAVTSVVFSRNGRFFVSGSCDRTLRLWQINTERSISLTTQHQDAVQSIAISPNGQLIASGSKDKTIELWDLSTRQIAAKFGGDVTAHQDAVQAVAFSQDGRWLISGSLDQTIKIWDVQAKTLHQTIKGYEGPIYDIAVHPNGYWFLAGGYDPHLRFRKLPVGNLVLSLQEESRYITSVAFSASGLLATGGLRTIRLWNVQKRRKIRTLNAHADAVLTLAFSPDGRYLVSGGYDGATKLWDIQSMSEVMTLDHGQRPIYAVAFSPDGQYILSAGEHQQIVLWQRRKT